MPAVRFVDVFSDRAFRGNALAVLHDADGLDDDEMLAVARWTNLSETTFLVAPTDAAADYRVRIWTTGGELPFAGHPTLGTAHAWLEAGGVPQRDGVVVQQCGAGLVEVRRDGLLRFAAPPLRRSGPVADDELGGSSTRCGSTRVSCSARPGSTTGRGGSGCSCAPRRTCSPRTPTAPAAPG